MTDRDTHLQKILELHFNENTGAPYWLEKKEELPFDPLTDVETLADIELFVEDPAYGTFPYDELRFNARAFVPKGLDEYYLFSSGGRTGTPKWRAWALEGTNGALDGIIDRAMERLEDEDFEPGGDIAYIGPMGPHAIGKVAEQLALAQDGSMVAPDLDPRWIRLIRSDSEIPEIAHQKYLNHIKTQVIFKQHGDDLNILFSTPSLIEGIFEEGALDMLDLDVIFFGGQAMVPENYLALDEDVDAALIGFYGNTMIGAFPQVRFNDDNEIVYQANETQCFYEIVEPDSIDRNEFTLVDYGERGRTLAHTFIKGLFAPYVVEDDAATRLKPRKGYQTDAIGNPDVPEEDREDIESGVN